MSSSDSPASTLIVRQLGRCDYVPVWEAMQRFTLARGAETLDEMWAVEHPPVFTQGLNGKAENILNPGHIPVVQVDRGGQVTYHAPGQLVLYVLIDLGRRRLGIKDLVRRLEDAVIDSLKEYRILAARRDGAPGVYVAGAKIAALGLRVKRGCSYHGLSFNIDMDLTPFQGIHPCGFKEMAVTQLRDLGIRSDINRETRNIVEKLRVNLGYGHVTFEQRGDATCATKSDTTKESMNS